MFKTYSIHAALAAVLFITLPISAKADNCDQPNLTGFDSVYCFSKVYIGEDTRLNNEYSALRGILSSAERNTLRTAQLNWIAYRDRSCMTGPTTVNVDCALRVTRERADFLSARITECRTVGCAASKLDDY
jgi:uncharacterized protein YecT (DUF1311 family)